MTYQHKQQSKQRVNLCSVQSVLFVKFYIANIGFTGLYNSYVYFMHNFTFKNDQTTDIWTWRVPALEVLLSSVINLYINVPSSGMSVYLHLCSSLLST
jgi:hypothetical protein